MREGEKSLKFTIYLHETASEYTNKPNQEILSIKIQLKYFIFPLVILSSINPFV